MRWERVGRGGGGLGVRYFEEGFWRGVKGVFVWGLLDVPV